jgi:hypothetical protein
MCTACARHLIEHADGALSLSMECPTCKQSTCLPGITIPEAEQEQLVLSSMARFGVAGRKTTIAVLKQCWEG